MADKPTTCPYCNGSLAGAQWSIAHGLAGPQPFTQCPACHQLIYVAAPEPKPAA